MDKEVKPIYVLTVIEHDCKKADGAMYEGTRTWGWWPTLKEAVRVVESNETDINETCYNYALIEKYHPGIGGHAGEGYGPKIMGWWEWIGGEAGKYCKMDKPPKFAKNICNWGLG